MLAPRRRLGPDGRRGTLLTPSTPVEAMATSSAELLRMSTAQLDDLFRVSPAGQIPSSHGQGTIIVAPGTRLAQPASKVLGLMWRGKVFRPGELQNEILPFGLDAVAARVYKGPSWFDDRECIVLDYSQTSRVAGWIRDEIREISPTLYLGLVWGVGRAFGGRRRLFLKFALDF